MIRSYLGYIKKIEMISRRLTKTQKSEILEAYRAGGNTNALAEKYNCTTNTINRTVKTLLSDSEYKLLKEKRSKIINKKIQFVDKETQGKKVNEYDLSIKEVHKDYDTEDNKITSLDFKSKNITSENYNNEINESDKNIKNSENSFEVIAPLISSFDFDLENQKTEFEILNYESLPQSVYMIVDKKVELDLLPLSDLPEWSFLPENELKRNAILLFSNQRTAKRSCSRNQRVIKIPNTNVFKVSKSYLVSNGITRLILEDSIIALDN